MILGYARVSTDGQSVAAQTKQCGEAERLALPPARDSGLVDAVLVQASGAGPILAAAKD